MQSLVYSKLTLPLIASHSVLCTISAAFLLKQLNLSLMDTHRLHTCTRVPSAC